MNLKSFLVFSALIFVLVGVSLLADRSDSAEARAAAERTQAEVTERQKIEDKATIEPPVTTIPLDTDRVLKCVVFPMHSYDGLLLHCTACREETSSMAEKPMAVTCVR